MCSINSTKFLYQAINKEQHALNIETFKLIFMNKLPLLDSNRFSQIALHLYQELFKINNISIPIITIQIMSTQSCMEYISKLAFKSANNEVNISAIRILNSHYIQTDTIKK